jgi:hypothetical protein
VRGIHQALAICSLWTKEKRRHSIIIFKADS